LEGKFSIQIEPRSRINENRARDSPDEEEKDILSSTSENVREIWDGNRVIRQTGEPKTTQFVHRVNKGGGARQDRWGLWTLEEAVQSQNSSPSVYGPTSTISEYQDPESRSLWYYKNNNLPTFSLPALTSRQSRKETNHRSLAENLKVKAPNLTLNTPEAVRSSTEIWFLASVGLLVQLTVIIFNAVVAYHWKWVIVASYGYPVWTIGTVLITIGVSTCGYVVEHSTTEINLEPSEENSSLHSTNDATRIDDIQPPKSTFRVFSLQEELPTLGIPYYAIFANKEKQQVRLSWRSPTDDGSSTTFCIVSAQILTAFGTSCTIAGFICQNIGTRELHWSAGVSQLVATLFTAVLRALARRHVGDPPGKDRPLTAGMEASQLVCELHNLSRLTLYSGPQTPYIAGDDDACGPCTPPVTPTVESSVQVTDCLRSHAKLAEFTPVNEEVSKVAVAVVKACEDIRDIMKLDNGKKDKALEVHFDMECMPRVMLFSKEFPSGTFAAASFSLSDLGLIRAILSLSVYHESLNTNAHPMEVAFILGSTEGNTDIIEATKLGLQKWMPHGTLVRDQEAMLSINSTRQNGGVSYDQVFGLSFSATSHPESIADPDNERDETDL
jgi:hypothetical protein